MIPLRDVIPSKTTPVVTVVLIAANAAAWIYELALPSDTLSAFLNVYGVVPAAFNPPSLFSSMFLHGSWSHFIGNMWYLWIFGDNVEDRMGPVRFVVFYLLCGFIAGIVHWFINADSMIPAVGASGAIAGVLGAYFVLFPHAHVIVMFPVLFVPVFFALPAVTYLGFWALSQVFSGTLSLAQPGDVGGVAFWAHAGGFAAGMALHIVFVRRGPSDRRLARDEYWVESAWVPSQHWRVR